MGGKAKTPAPNPEADYAQYLTEARNALRVQGKILPEMAGLQEQLAPILARSQGAVAEAAAGEMLGITGRLYQPAMDMQRRVSEGQLSQLAFLAPKATEAAIGGMDATTRGIYQTFGQQALSDLQAGTSLSAAETTQAQQAARAAAAARGLTFSRQGTDLEVLNTYNMGQARQRQRQATAQQAFALGQGVQSLGMTGFLSPSLQAGAAYSPAALTGYGYQTAPNLADSFLQPESQYLANIRANRIQMETAIQSANAQRSGGIIGGALQAVGTYAGYSAMAACWVAREVYGKDNPEWLVFRHWLFTEAPDWFRDLYLEEGERFAEFISDKPMLKSLVKMGMDLVVKHRFKYLAA